MTHQPEKLEVLASFINTFEKKNRLMHLEEAKRETSRYASNIRGIIQDLNKQGSYYCDVDEPSSSLLLMLSNYFNKEVIVTTRKEDDHIFGTPTGKYVEFYTICFNEYEGEEEGSVN